MRKGFLYSVFVAVTFRALNAASQRGGSHSNQSPSESRWVEEEGA